jgi:hypothetical protein
MLAALLDWKKTCAYVRCGQDSQEKLSKQSRYWVGTLRRKNGWTDKWFQSNEAEYESEKIYDPSAPRVPLGWHVFESYMTSRRTIVAEPHEGAVYKDHMFKRISGAADLAAAFSRAGYYRMLSALKEVIKIEGFTVTYPDENKDKNNVRYVALTPENPDVPGMGMVVDSDDEKDLSPLLTEEFISYVFDGLNLTHRQRSVIFFSANNVTFSDERLREKAVTRLTGTESKTVLYDSFKSLSLSLKNALSSEARKRLAGSKGNLGNVDPYEVAILSKMLLPRLAAKCSEWAKEQGLWAALFLPGNK